MMVLCAGLKSSGSTWAYNVVMEILKATNAKASSRGRKKVAAFYADKMESFPAAAGAVDQLVIKTHIPAPAILLLSQIVRAKVIVSVREPRDAIASLLQRFGHDFDVALGEVAAGAQCLVKLAAARRCMILRYEDRFYARIETVKKIADFLGVKLPHATLARIQASLTPERVSRRILTLHRTGAFGKRPTSNSFDPLTHWHPGHVGDGRIGKYSTTLSPKQQKSVLSQTRLYRKEFGYPASTAIGKSRKASLRARRRKG
jgi:hypothetical protein